MADIVDASTRSIMMSRVKGKNTRQEVEIRKRLFALGFRYRLHDKKLPGKPDIVLRKYRAVIFINGCFWHAHDCPLFKWPTSKKVFWKKKLSGNKERDYQNTSSLIKLGWRIFTVWECSFRSAGRDRTKEINLVAIKVAKWLYSNKKYGEIPASIKEER
jgi:DNA mismatch endonuclease, patch repair protein